ncbi:CocE/NonD family hydrolase C-terminal non-catalytic domain-containing protein [Streptomyces sp. NPDC017202]|uniref:CocE/NonD family hydrolase C-terminal non-catalytic domain-containing protein n=1 Tax=Streptomyces sp. NPDC017202 TaxID=3364981 RepID=UPI0037874DB8
MAFFRRGVGRCTVPLTPGGAYTITLDPAATDHVVPAGHRLAPIVAGPDKDLGDPPADTPTLTPDLSRTTANIPFVVGGGARAFAAAPRPARRRPPRPPGRWTAPRPRGTHSASRSPAVP